MKIDTSAMCPFCRSHASGLSVRLDLERQPPEEFSRFAALVTFALDHQLLSCPACGTIFRKQRFIDNEPGSSTDTLEYGVVSREEADGLISWWKARGGGPAGAGA